MLVMRHAHQCTGGAKAPKVPTGAEFCTSEDVVLRCGNDTLFGTMGKTGGYRDTGIADMAGGWAGAAMEGFTPPWSTRNQPLPA